MATSTKRHSFNRFKSFLQFFRSGFNHLLWPDVCQCCQASVHESDLGFCHDCWNDLLKCASGDYCPRCGRDTSRYALIENACVNCQGKHLFFDGIARTGVYDQPLRDMILAFKFQDKTELAPQLVSLLNSTFQACPFFDSINFLVPVPLHWTRCLIRGYNQSLLLAKALKHPLARVNTDLVRIRYTKKQFNLSPAKRKQNVKDAFAVRKGHKFSGSTVCLVDDITTSQATLNECAKTLKQAGAEKVFALVLAVAMQDTR